ncbi:hypothetical protein CDCA_CDCA15G4009 [Cyanidium caldarium]|uniref:RING-type E3 ubiquitin transferase n=1 Tax=Cyanidium caldarium TaxID=2771 RepID=A0AAV9J0A9_CYACA|nr:hypothetical protein CDCA_CDCA15G4009 [Cyanidium caldarium]
MESSDQEESGSATTSEPPPSATSSADPSPSPAAAGAPHGKAEKREAPSNTPDAMPVSVPTAEAPFECSICFEVAHDDPVVTFCGHLFCWSCLYPWMVQHATCPVCKSLVNRNRVIPLYGRGGASVAATSAVAKRKRPAGASAASSPDGAAEGADGATSTTPPRPAAQRVEVRSSSSSSSSFRMRPPPPPLFGYAAEAGEANGWGASGTTADSPGQATGGSTFFAYPAGGISFTPFGLFPSLLGVQFTFPPPAAPPPPPPSPPRGSAAASGSASTGAAAAAASGGAHPFGGTWNNEDAAQAMVSRMLLMLGMFVLMCLLFF